MTVYLVGAGPGDPGLITARGLELLHGAEVVVYDRLASSALVDAVPESAVRIDVGKRPGEAPVEQDEINAILIEHGRAGARVVRLKGGDPFVFGRGGEEAEALADAGVPFEVVPGVTSAVAAPAYAGIPVTHRGLSTHFTVVTGHEDPSKGRTDVDWEALARAGGTLVILMGVGNLDEIAKRLVAGGLSDETPVAAVQWGTRPEQRTVRATLGTITAAGVSSPSAIVVGEVAGLDLGWFEHRPLFGRSVVVTRAREQASALRARLEGLGAEVIELPSIEIRPVDFVVPDVAAYRWLVFTSVNGVAAFFERGLGPRGLDARALAGASVAAIGPGTAEALERYGIRVDLVPDRFVAESLVEVFPEPVGDERVLIPRAAVARDALPDGLVAKGYVVDVLAVYETVRATPDPDQVERVRRGEVDALTFTSSSTVRNLVEVLGGPPPPGPVIACIGPVTAETARECGLEVSVEAGEHTIDGLVAALVSHVATA